MSLSSVYDMIRWDMDIMALNESRPKVLCSKAPVILFKPILADQIPEKKNYKCPLYRTAERRGVLATTGHSSNFVLDIRFPSMCSEDHWIRRGVAALLSLSD